MLLKRIRNTVLSGCAMSLLALSSATVAGAEEKYSGDAIKIGILNDMSGPYSDANGIGVVNAVELAVEEMGGSIDGRPIQILNLDTQLKADIASAAARKWLDEDHVDALMPTAGSGMTIAALEVGKDKNVTVLNAGGISSALSNESCTPLSSHWTLDTYAAAKLAVKAGIEAGAKKWFFITADYSFGHNLERDATANVEQMGGTVVGSVRAPLGTSDFSSFLLQAQSSGADIIAFANAGGDTTNSLKQAHEFGITAGGQKIIGLVTSVTDVVALGLDAAQGLMVAEAWYADRDDASREFTKRFQAKDGRSPTLTQVVSYASVLHYLRSVKEAKTDDAVAVNEMMRKLPTKDAYTIEGKIREEDGRLIPKSLYMLQVKSPSESTGKFDLYKLVSTVSGDEAYRPLSESKCPLVKH
ncbi:ABC transporter substrate-binding protein [Mesorhizobium sp. ANAO-SY3R2]|uniref:ABC transporter substrate-binding protein n=1 Tax=Mesorhizobium sp. ANAO-SY3R2 TaxID=3166644 RepID=UPI00366BBC6E